MTPITNTTSEVEAGRQSEAVESDRTSVTRYLGSLALLGRGWRYRWRRVQRWSASTDDHRDNSDHSPNHSSAGASISDQHTLDESTTTVRMRKPSRHKRTWEADSDDVQRATKTQLLAPTAGFTLANLFQGKTVDKAEGSPISPSSCEQGEAGFTTSSRCPWHDGNHKTSPSVTTAGLPLSSRSEEHPQAEFPTTIEACTSTLLRHPARRVQTWAAHGMDDRSVSAFVIDIDDEESIEAPSTIRVPKTRKGARGTEDSTAEAERMSMIDVPRLRGCIGECEGEDSDRLS
ncbi:MAG: hypothetical protein Q9219_000887 [cf. Caloplaca sp. 3 TL-2023]